MNTLPPWLAIPVVAAATTLGLKYGNILHTRGITLGGNIRIQDCPLIPAALLVVVLAQVAASTLPAVPAIAWHLPVLLEYYLAPALWALKLACIAFGLTAIVRLAWKLHHRRRHLLVILSLIIIVAVEGLSRFASRPYLGEIVAKERYGAILQSDASTCAPAAAANITRYFGLEITEAEMVERMNTTWAGTSPAQMIVALRELGFTSTKVYRPDKDLAQVKHPAILLVDFGGQPDGHAIAYIQPVENSYSVIDPNAGRAVRELSRIRQRWGGRAIEIRPK